MWPWAGELLGRLLWRSEDVGIRFVGAMLSVGLAIVGLWMAGQQFLRRFGQTGVK